MIYVFFNIWTYSLPEYQGITHMIWVMIRSKNESSKILVLGEWGSSPTFFNQKCPLWVTKVNLKAKLCNSTGTSNSTHQGHLFQELSLVTLLHTPWKVSFKRGYFPTPFSSRAKHIDLCLCQVCMHYANLSTRHKR